MTDHRPILHITPQRGWLNDPNGLTHRDGTWHVFYQYNPSSPDWGPPHWAHVTSGDLVSWESQPVALSPLGAGSDADGIWSGCVVDDQGTPTAVYTGVRSLGPDRWEPHVCLARGDASMETWTRDPANPVLSSLPHGGATVGFRDPWVWRERDEWAMVMGTGIEGVGGALALYRSKDLRTWRYEGVPLQRDEREREPVWTGRMWECPQLAPLGDQHVLVVSVWDDRSARTLNYPVAAIGRFDGLRFEVERWRRFDHGPDCYAPAFLIDAGRVLAWGWSWEALSDQARREQGWASCLTFPRELGILPDGDLMITPAPELESARRDHVVLASKPLSAEQRPLPATGRCLEIESEFALGPAGQVRLEVLRSPDGEETTSIAYDAGRSILSLDRTQASVWGEASGGVHEARLPLDPDGRLRLRVLVDTSIVEVFANDRVVMTARVYPTRPDSVGTAVSGSPGTRLVAGAAWRLAAGSD